MSDEQESSAMICPSRYSTVLRHLIIMAAYGLLLPVWWCRGDVSLPPGKLYINVPVWGRVVSRTKGTLTVKQRRWIVRLESRLVGRLVAEVMPEGSDDLALGAVRVKQGDLDGPVYFNKQQ